jgi:hypothetical protein
MMRGVCVCQLSERLRQLSRARAAHHHRRRRLAHASPAPWRSQARHTSGRRDGPGPHGPKHPLQHATPCLHNTHTHTHTRHSGVARRYRSADIWRFVCPWGPARSTGQLSEGGVRRGRVCALEPTCIAGVAPAFSSTAHAQRPLAAGRRRPAGGLRPRAVAGGAAPSWRLGARTADPPAHRRARTSRSLPEAPRHSAGNPSVLSWRSRLRWTQSPGAIQPRRRQLGREQGEGAGASSPTRRAVETARGTDARRWFGVRGGGGATVLDPTALSGCR